MKSKTTKYNQKKVVISGINFDSKTEAKRYRELLLLEKAGHIKNIKIHPNFVLQKANKKNREHQISYSPDFRYTRTHDGQDVAEEVKSKATRTEAYSIRRRLFLSKEPYIEFIELILVNKKWEKKVWEAVQAKEMK